MQSYDGGTVALDRRANAELGYPHRFLSFMCAPACVSLIVGTLVLAVLAVLLGWYFNLPPKNAVCIFVLAVGVLFVAVAVLHAYR